MSGLVLDRFYRRVSEEPGAPLFTFVGDDGRDEGTLTVGETARWAEAIAGNLRYGCGLSPGDRVLLVYLPSIDFVKAFVGCLVAGLVPVPLPPPDPMRINEDLARFTALAESSGARAVLTSTRYAMAKALGSARHVLSRPWRRWPDLPWHSTDRWRLGSFDAPPRPVVTAADTAFLQYTSGSTSRPKGVMITHGNLAHQLEANRRELGMGPRSRMVAWVPHFHDFGLISGIMSSLHGNGSYTMLSPLTFIQRPQRWFEVMTRVRATHTAAPTFGYEFAVRKTTERERALWDLSSLEIAMCAAEPIHPETARRFNEAFAASKLRPQAFCPAYGLAEHTVGVSTCGRGSLSVDRASFEREGRVVPATASGDSRALVACGAPSDGVRVRVVDPVSGRELPKGRVGEIWVDSPSKAAGYFGLPDETERTFRARLEGDPTEYLRTGDLGLLFEGQLYITGRLKDVIIVRGRNLYPQDIEDTIRDGHPQVRPGGVAAFSIEEQGAGGEIEERLVLVAEVRDARLSQGQAGEVVQALQRLVREEHQLACRAVVLLAPGAVPKTTSGKVMRRACRDAFVSGALLRGALHVARSSDADPPGRPAASSAASAASAAEAAVDRRRQGLDPEFARLCGEVEATFAAMARARRGRVFHKQATTLRGSLRVLDQPEIPAHRFLSPGASYDVIVRHANGVQEDDAGWDNRGATVRVLPRGAAELGAPLLDLLLTTGSRFLARSARDFQRWVGASREEREAMVRAEPHRGAAAWEMFRSPRSYAELHYHSKIASRFTAADGGRWLARFRIIPGDRSADTGFVEPGGAPLPADHIPRAAGDERSRTFLHEELRARVATGPVRYLLQAQLRSASAPGGDEQALDCTLAWREPWRDVAALTLASVVDEASVEGLCFDPFHAPDDLALPLARSADESASLGHLRSIVYEAAARARLDERARAAEHPEAPHPEAPRPEVGLRRKRVCVIGAGAAGLAAAWALEREGHQVTVLERAPTVAGKCASFEVDGRSYDWGGHLCTAHYTSLASMVDALGVKTEPATPTLVYDLETRRVRPREESPRLRQEFLRYQALRGRFSEITLPGLHRVAGALARPVGAWLREEDLRDLGATVGINYTSCGYGFLDDPELASMYLLKAAEMGGILSTGKASGLPEAWSIQGGFGAFWRKVAAGLRDVRCGVSPSAIERHGDVVTVQAGGTRLVFDRLVVAAPLDEALSFLDASPGERDLFSRIRYTDYHTIACRARGLPTGGFYLLKQRCEDGRHAGHPVAFHHRYEGSDVYLFYSYGRPGISLDGLVERLREDVARMGGAVDEIIAHRAWKYFPHASSADIQAGFYEKLEALQGERQTFYVGGVFNFELIECNVSYAHDLVARFFRDAPAAEAPAAPGAPPPALPAALARASSSAERADLLRAYLQRLFVEELRLEQSPPVSSRFLDLGLDSVRSVEIFQRLAVDTGGRTLAPVIFFDHPTLDELAVYLADELVAPAAPAATAATAATAPRARPAAAGRLVETELYTQIEDVVFAEAHGIGLTLDVFVPTGAANGLAVVDVASALWSSGRDVILNHKILNTYDAFCRQGFTVFAVRPGSAARFCGDEMVTHIREAIRWVKSQAAAHGIDAGRIGLMGGSAGGHLACLAALTPVEGEPGGAGPRARHDSRVQALVAYCPMTRHRESEIDPAYAGLLRQIAFAPGQDVGRSEAELAARYEALSPLSHVNPGAPPTLLLHGLHDRVIPHEASARFTAALRAVGVRAELLSRDSDRHPWPGIEKDMILAAGWMEATLLGRVRAASPWLRVIRPVEAPSQRLVCIHHAGGTSGLFDAWAAGLPADTELLAVELPGRGARASEAPCTSMAALLAALDDAIEPLLDRPCSLLGHSLGALVAFELCRRRRRRGAALPSRLYVSGFVAPKAARAGAAYQASDVGAAFDHGGPGLEADFKLFASWTYAAEAPLALPITALGGASDPFTPPAALDAWRDETSAPFDRELFAGHHFYLRTDPAPLLARLSRDLVSDARAADLAALASSWRARPHALSGAWNLFDLCWLARVGAPGSTRPAFAEALATLLQQQRPDGGVGAPSPHPYCNLVTSLAFAATLLRWNDDGRHDEAIRRALGHALAEHERPQEVGAHDRHFRFHGFFGRWLIPARESQLLLERGGRLLSPEQRRMVASFASARQAAFAPEIDHATLFEQDSMLLHFAEYFPDAAHALPAAAAHALRVEGATGLPGMTAAAAARFHEVSGDERSRALLAAALARPLDGLRPGGRLQELQFALAYLQRGGVDVARHFEPELREMRAAMGAGGVGVEPASRLPDADASAVAQRVCHAAGLASPMPTRHLETFWDTAKASYQSADGHATYTMSTTLHVLEAYLVAPDVTDDERLAVWKRVIDLLEARPWTELHHLSPLYVWEKVASIVGAHAQRFARAPTRAHLDALERILQRQGADGGFSGATDAATVEETALALLALRSALSWPGGTGDQARVEASARRARSFLLRERHAPRPDLWVGKLLYTPHNLVEAIVTAALAG